MNKNTQSELVFESTKGKKVTADFQGGTITSDAGLLLLRSLSKQIGLIDNAARSLKDRRHSSYVDHTIKDLLTQRIMQIASGYYHSLDCNRMRDDVALKVACDKSHGESLSSQSTMSRLENSLSRTDLYRLSLTICNQFTASYKKPPKRIILDIDDTCDPTHGAQQLSIFNAFDDTYCYRPLHIYEGKTGKLVTAVLRPGKRPSGTETSSILQRVIKEIRSRWPKVKILIRGDSHFGNEAVMNLCESFNNVEYVLCVAKNKVLARLCEEGFSLQRGYQTHEDFRHYEAFDYAANSWSKKRRVIARIEVKGESEDVRYIVTNVKGRTARYLYEKIYCGRCQAENWIKDHKNSLRSDLTSCHQFSANYFRLLLHSMAYILLHEFRTRALKNTKLASAQMDTIRLRILKVGARVVEKSKVIRFHLPDVLSGDSMFKKAYRNLFGT